MKLTLTYLMAGVALLAFVACDDAEDTTPEQDADVQILDEDTAETSATDTAVAPDSADDDTAELVDTAEADTAELVDSVEVDTQVADVPPDTSVVEDTEDADVLDVADTVGEDVVAPIAPLPLVLPDGFYEISSGRGVTVYQKDYDPGLPDWVTVVDLRVAQLEVVIGDFVSAPMGSVEQRAFIEHWDDAVSREAAYGRRAKVMINGGFFSTDPDPAPIAFGLKVDGVVVSYGYGLDEFPGYNKTIAWTPPEPEPVVDDYNILTFEAFDNVVGGLAHDTPHDAAGQYTGRTMIGTKDFDDDGEAEAVFFFSSAYTSQSDAATVLMDFGATELVMLDGGGSSALLVDGTELVHPKRRHPISIVAYEGIEPSGCAEDCGAFGSCDPATGACVCEAGFSGAACGTCSVCEPDEVLVDDGDAGFATYGQEYWYVGQDSDTWQSGAEGADFHYTFGDPAGQLVWLARWVSPHPLDGTYDVEVHVAPIAGFDPGYGVSSWTTCDTASYLVAHDTSAQGGEPVTLDHHTAGWVTLRADAQFSRVRGEVRLHDVALPSLCGVQADAVRWVRKD